MGDSWFDYDKRLRPQHLKGAVTVTIRSVGEIKSEFEKDEVVPVLLFKESVRYLELNDTNRLRLVDLFGETKWTCIGKKIKIAAQRVNNGKLGLVILGDADGAASTAPLPTETAPGSSPAQPADSDPAPASNAPLADIGCRLAAEIRVSAHAYLNATKRPDANSVQRLAAIVGQAFEGKPAEEQSALRHAVYSVVYGREVTSGGDVPNGIVMALLARWTDSSDPWRMNQLGHAEAKTLASAYQVAKVAEGREG